MNIVYKPHYNARSIRVRLTGTNTLVITYPRSLPRSRVNQYFLRNEHRIIAECTSHVDTSFEKIIQTPFHVLPDNGRIRFIRGTQNNISSTGTEVIIQYRMLEAFQNTLFVSGMKKAVTLFLRKRAKPFLYAKTAKLAEKHGYTYNSIFLKNQKTRWGSCSSANNINLNIRLLMLPEHLLEYVILHELVHTVEKNHSSRFWNLLESHIPDCKLRRRELKSYLFSFLD